MALIARATSAETQGSHSIFSNFFYEFMTIFAEILGHFGTLFSDFFISIITGCLPNLEDGFP